MGDDLKKFLYKLGRFLGRGAERVASCPFYAAPGFSRGSVPAQARICRAGMILSILRVPHAYPARKRVLPRIGRIAQRAGTAPPARKFHEMVKLGKNSPRLLRAGFNDAQMTR